MHLARALARSLATAPGGEATDARRAPRSRHLFPPRREKTHALDVGDVNRAVQGLYPTATLPMPTPSRCGARRTLFR